MSLVDTFLNWGVFHDALPLLLTGLWVTLGLGAAAIYVALLLPCVRFVGLYEGRLRRRAR